jgi:vacuolar-type H+-ATPase subunit F/Vma7
MPRLLGVTHVHSTYSFDGKLQLREVARFFRERGVDFVLMSEHIEEIATPRIRDFVRECRAISDDNFTLVPGIEMDEFHILLFGVEEPEDIEDHRALMEHFLKRGALMVLSHPVKIRRGIPEHVRPRLAGVEVWNSRHDGRVYPRLSNIRLYDELRRSSSRPLPALCGLDFHSRQDEADLRLEIDAPDRSPRAILEEIRQGRTRILKGGQLLPLDRLAASRTSLYRMKAAGYRTAYEQAYRINRGLKRWGLRVPPGLRRFARKLF